MDVKGAVRSNGVVLGAIAIGVVLLGVLALIGWSLQSGGGLSAVDATATSVAADRAEATVLVAEFARAVAVGDADALYAIQTGAYREGCSRADFQAVADSIKGQQFLGIIDLRFEGDVAGATVGLKLPNGSTTQQVLPLERDTDGLWRIAAPVVGRCSP